MKAFVLKDVACDYHSAGFQLCLLKELQMYKVSSSGITVMLCLLKSDAMTMVKVSVHGK